MGEIHVKWNVSPEEFLADLTDAVYQVVLKSGFGTPFIEMELDIQFALREVIRKDMSVSHDSQGCGTIREVEPWSFAADVIFEEREAEYAKIGLRPSF